MYIKRIISRMMEMKKNTWMFISMCFVASYIYLITAMFMLMLMPETRGNAVTLINAAEVMRMPQAVLIICALGSVIIEEQLQGKN